MNSLFSHEFATFNLKISFIEVQCAIDIIDERKKHNLTAVQLFKAVIQVFRLLN